MVRQWQELLGTGVPRLQTGQRILLHSPRLWAEGMRVTKPETVPRWKRH